MWHSFVLCGFNIHIYDCDFHSHVFFPSLSHTVPITCWNRLAVVTLSEAKNTYLIHHYLKKQKQLTPCAVQ